MTRRIALAACAATLAWAASGATAQGPMGNLTPAQQQVLQGKVKAWQTFMKNNKHVMTVTQTLRAIGEMNKKPATALDKSQAKTILAALKPWTTRKVMTNDAALELSKAITRPLTERQLKVLASELSGGQGGGAGSGGGGMMGGRSTAGAGRSFDPASIPDPKPFNPLNPDSMPKSPFTGRAKQMLSELMGQLESRAK